MSGQSVGGALRAAIVTLSGQEARREAELLVSHVTGLGRAGLIAHSDRLLDDSATAAIQSLVDRRRHGEPIAYLLGRREFFGLVLDVSPAVLIPRPETELLVETALERLPHEQVCTVLDLGTGSGAIALAIASHRPQADVLATDASMEALAVARSNARRLDLSNVRFTFGSWFDAVPEGATFDLVASNPPYVAGGDPHLQQGDLRFEPAIALSPGGDGLDAYRSIVSRATHYLKPDGWLMFEHGWDQGPAVRALLESSGFAAVTTLLDLEQRDRVTIGQRKD